MKLQRMALVAIAILLLVSCGTNESSAQPTRPSLKATVLHVIRPAGNFPAFDRTIKDAMAVQHLYEAAYALPVPTPGGTVNCPMDDGTVYNLDFLHGTTFLEKMILRATGCQTLQMGNNTSNVRYTNEAFRSLFIKTVEIPSLIPR